MKKVTFKIIKTKMVKASELKRGSQVLYMDKIFEVTKVLTPVMVFFKNAEELEFEPSDMVEVKV